MVLVCFSSYCEEVKLTSPNYTTVHDDHYAEVPLQFVFPFYDEEFDTSYMFTNGVVGFRNPTQSSVQSHWCCQGRDLENQQNISQYGYATAPLWTDLIDLGVEGSGLFTEGDALQQTYMWRNLAEYRDATRLNSFKLQIKQDGSYTVDYTAVNIVNHAIAIGDTGNLSQGYQGTQNYYYPSGYTGVPQGYGNEQNSINVLSTLCSANALYDPQCSGYAEAYAQQLYTQECNQDTLYDNGCSGYEEAYFIDQCTTDATYDRTCQGYTEAYLEQQCMYSPQYDITCVGYIEEQEPIGFVEVEDGTEVLGDNPINEVLEQPDIITDFANTSGYEIEGMPSASAPVFEMPIEVFEPEVFEQALPEVVNEMQQMEQELEMEVATIEPEPQTEPRELEQEEVLEPEVAEEPVEEIVDLQEEQGEELVVEEEVAVEEELEPTKEIEVETKVATKEKDVKAKTTVKLLPNKKELTKSQKIKILVAKKANALTKKIESAVTLEQQILVQQQLLSLISFVPDFNYTDSEIQDRASFYPPSVLADSSFSRWFRTDPNFERLEDSQYPQRNTQWQR